MPPKKSKKPSKNGYWQFVLECRDKQPNKHMSMGELQNYASRKWANMSKEERQPYEGIARLARDTYNPVKYTSDGLDIEEVERQEKADANRLREMKEDINNSLKLASLSQTLEELKFLIIHINHLTHYPAENRYFICEIALSAVSLKNGVEEVYHSIVKPGKLPLGFYGPALAHSKETHQLVHLVQEEPCENNTADVCRDVMRFIKKHSQTGDSLKIYADEKTHELTTNVFDNWSAEFDLRQEVKIYNFQYLFQALRNSAAGKTIWPNESFSYSELEKDIYSYTANISCEFHEMSDLSVYCSKSIVTRYGYTLCDHCCADLGIELIPGFHVPNNAKVAVKSQTSSKAPSISNLSDMRERSRSGSISSSTYDDNFPPLGSSGSSLISFSSMKTRTNEPTGSRAAARIEQSFRALNVTAKRDHTNLRFPARGCDN